MFEGLQNQIRTVLEGGTSCIACGGFDVLEVITVYLTQAFFIRASETVFALVVGLMTLRILWDLVGSLMGRPFDRAELGSMVLRCVLVLAFVSQPEALFNAFYTVYGLAMNLSADVIGTLGNTDAPTTESGMAGILEAAEKSLQGGFGQQIASMWRDLSWRDVGGMLAIIPLILLTVILVWEMLKYFFRPMFIFYGIGMLLPVVMACIIFNPTIKVAVNALRVMVSAGLQLVMATAVVSFVLLIIAAMAQVAGEGGIVLLGSTYISFILLFLVLIFLFPVIMELPKTLFEVFDSGEGGGGMLKKAAKAIPGAGMVLK